ncbi:unnamed protein product [Paramecium primaurelia]|uniref:Uncharacterized protein n=1 Tax=Paramecium primaurelia TaxID=5886 RepID=A0A8S1QHI1_PARPR|nr:unnamed protein product [Paramecium primaurelia]
MEVIDNKSRSYCKVSKQKQEQLLNLVYKDEFRINQAADFLNINYATAKNIIRRFKKIHIFRKCGNISESKRCHYKQIVEQKEQKNGINTKGGLIGDCLTGQVQKV